MNVFIALKGTQFLNFICKSEPLNRETMYLPFKLGGQNLVNISLKLDCLSLKHVKNLISGCTAKWTLDWPVPP